MSSMLKCWSLFNKEDKLRIDDLTIEQVRTILLAIPSARMKDWYACRESEVHWQNLTEISEFYEDVRNNKGNSYLEEAKPEVTAQVLRPTADGDRPKSMRRPLFEEVPMDGGQTAPTLAIESVQTKERRSARRYQRKLIFRLKTGKTVFESPTIDVSMSGLSLENPLPPGLTKNFRAEISCNGNSMHVVCSKVSDNQLRLIEAEAWDVLRQWIANW